MKALLLLAVAASGANLRGTTQVRSNAQVTVTPIVTLSSPLNAPPLVSPILAPSIISAANAPLPSIAPLPALAAPPALPAALPAALAAAADGPAPQPLVAPEAGSAAADSPSFVGRTLRALGRIVNPFGGAKTPPELPPPASEAERLDREFSRLDLWGPAAERARAEIQDARAKRLSKADFKRYVQDEAAAAFERVRAARGVSNIGLHYNLHGGRRQDYVGKGIRASMGDIALRYGGGDSNMKVYFFQTRDHHPYVALDASNGEILVLPSRMGHVLNFFDVDAPPLLAAKESGRIRNHSVISMDFHGMGGIPYSAYLAPPIEVFNGSAKKALGIGRLSRDEETLATVRYIEQALMAGGGFVPR